MNYSNEFCNENLEHVKLDSASGRLTHVVTLDGANTDVLVGMTRSVGGGRGASNNLVIWNGRDGQCVRQILLDREHFTLDSHLLKCQLSGGLLLLVSSYSSHFFFTLINVEMKETKTWKILEMQNLCDNERAAVFMLSLIHI